MYSSNNTSTNSATKLGTHKQFANTARIQRIRAAAIAGFVLLAIVLHWL